MGTRHQPSPPDEMSTQQMGVRAVERLKAWAQERDRAGDWPKYIRGSKINRSEMFKECGMSRSTLSSNAVLAETLAEIELDLVERDILSPSLDVESLPPTVRSELGAAQERSRRALATSSSLEKRVKSLEEQNAVLRAENRQLTERLRQSAFAEMHLANTGRLLPL